ncbi:response regulator [Azospirillum sp.]|uniref:response regulator n=1 Tax=Azospirillum sp. TaxID=34012 RepID=UPI002D2F9428|nr:response regulator [Azospirillum sp.]HYD69023.1 response regulator [Azospirillum sp.]
MAVPPELPSGGPRGLDSYDVDALLIELGGDDGSATESERNVCQTVEELYSSRTRFQMAEALDEFLDGRRITPTELLHTVEPQRQLDSWYRHDGVLERTAHAQSVPGRRTAAQRLEELKRLEQEAMVLTVQRAHKGAPPAFDARTFAAAVSSATKGGAGFGARYAIDAVLAAWLGESGSFEVKLMRLLSLDGDSLPPLGAEVIDQVIGEILASPAGVEELFGWVDGLRATLEVLAQVWRGGAVNHPHTPPVVRRLATYVGAREARLARHGLEVTLHRALLGDARLTPDNAYDARSITTIMDELLALGALAGKLRAHGVIMGGERTVQLLDRRAALLLGDDRLDAIMKGKSHHARLIDLFTFEGAAFGEASRKVIVGALLRQLDARDFTQRLFEHARTPRARIKALADIQRRVRQSGLTEAQKDKYARMLDDIQHTYLRTNRIFARIGKDKTPGVDEVMEFANLCAEGAFTDGKCMAAARELVGHHVRTTAFLRGYLARCKDDTQGRAERYAQFFGTLAAAGTPLRDMGTLRILLADDEPAARSYVEMILRDLGISDVVVAEDGQQALSAFEEQAGRLDLIICDWKMPRLSGLEFLKQVRAVRPEMPFLMVTALATMIAVEEALAHDVTAYIAKPFSPEQLEEKILVLVNR